MRAMRTHYDPSNEKSRFNEIINYAVIKYLRRDNTLVTNPAEKLPA